MPYLQRGALVEYSGETTDSVTNQVVFQFNPESLNRTIRIPSRPSGSQARETRQAGEVPDESISLTIHFSAADRLNTADTQALNFGISHRLAALERMTLPLENESGQETESVDPVADAVSGSSQQEPATQPTPRVRYPNVLFMWGEKRVLPVIIDSMTITEQQFDSNLNPIQAEVSLSLSVFTINPFTEDPVARGAANYSQLAKNEQVAANLAKGENVPGASKQQILDIIQF
jgi:hypothetical protein